MPTSPHAITSTILALVASIGLAGCFSDDGATTLAVEPSVTFDGTGNGFFTHYASCEGNGTAAGSGRITDGRVILRVTDSNGTELLMQSFDGDFTFDRTTLNGHPGEWKMDTQRSGSDVVGDEFSGTYEFTLDC